MSVWPIALGLSVLGSVGGLLLAAVILFFDHDLRTRVVPWLVGLYITAAYWFTASTSFANPAVAIARSLSNTFSGIRPQDLPGFIVAELAGAVFGLLFMLWLLRTSKVAEPVPQKAKL